MSLDVPVQKPETLVWRQCAQELLAAIPAKNAAASSGEYA